MKISFVKTLEGHEIEFVRLMYPLRYELFFRRMNANPLKLPVQKNSKGEWIINEQNDLPGWISELTLTIQSIIEENERDTTDSPV